MILGHQPVTLYTLKTMYTYTMYTLYTLYTMYTMYTLYILYTLQVDTALEGVEQTDLGQYLSLAEQYKPLLGPGHYQLVIIRHVVFT